MVKANKFAEALRGSETVGSAEMAKEPSTAVGMSRKGTKHVGGYFSPAVSKQLRQIALDENTSVQALVGESLDMLFESRGKPAIAAGMKSSG